jgi:hypothetical protein
VTQKIERSFDRKVSRPRCGRGTASKVLMEKIVMHSDYNGSTRRSRNLGRIVDFWDQKGKILWGERSCCIFCGSKYVTTC